ncbi:hypothetical protein BD770DRAFT_468418 [Pilaira anomala]|nr:hypothetical protein BD770DRAFT_468418 [Pilaira anomala]
MSELNLTQIVENASTYNCTHYDAQVSHGYLKFTIACIPSNATEISEFGCSLEPLIMIPYEADCDYIQKTYVNHNPDFVCSLYCTEAYENTHTLDSASKLLARGFSSIQGNATTNTIQPINFSFTFAALFFVMLVFYKRM